MKQENSMVIKMSTNKSIKNPNVSTLGAVKIVGVIPARYASSRFQGKALVDILGKPMVQRVYERAARAETLDAVIVATDDKRIYDVVDGFGGQVVMTSPDCPTGTERVAIVAETLDCDVVANIQGDEPLLEPVVIDQMIQPFLDDPSVEVSTLKQQVENEADYRDPNVVKVVTDLQGFALYFSRASTPGNLSNHWLQTYPTYRHVGLYAYRRERLLEFTWIKYHRWDCRLIWVTQDYMIIRGEGVKWERTPYESAEGLEQLRFLEHGIRIRVVETEHTLIGVDVPADLERVLEILKARK